jgi:lipopolysaccharide export system protein LptA
VLANRMVNDKKKNTILATQHPLMIIEQDKDSIYVTADTLFSARVADLADSAYKDLRKDTIKNTRVVNAGKDTSDTRFFQCYHHVRIFSDSLQAVSDSLFYSAKDSVFRLFINPIVWASQSQVTGDTIYLFTKNKKAERMYVFENSLAVNKSGDNMYNQVSGKTLNGYFKDGAIDYMRTKGAPAQSIYYAKDENDAMVGVNTASGDIIDMRFENKELKKVVFINDVSGTMYPFKQTPQEKKQLRSFKWLESKRPKTKFELFEEPVMHN